MENSSTKNNNSIFTSFLKILEKIIEYVFKELYAWILITWCKNRIEKTAKIKYVC